MARVSTAAMRRQARQSLDARFRRLEPADLPVALAVPKGGWVRAIREALGMSAADLATRIGVVESAVQRMEAGERVGTTQLATLQRAADALNCDLVYALVPRTPLAAQVTAQAEIKAQVMMHEVTHTMALEAQQVSREVTRELLDQHVAALEDKPGLWNAL